MYNIYKVFNGCYLKHRRIQFPQLRLQLTNNKTHENYT
jgi:hypothetical protein